MSERRRVNLRGPVNRTGGNGNAWHVVGVRPNGDRISLGTAKDRAEAEAMRAALFAGGIEGYEHILAENVNTFIEAEGRSTALAIAEEEKIVAEQRAVLRLSEAEERTPPISPVEAMRRQLQLALFDGVKEADVVAMTTKLKEMALGGDLRAMKLFFTLVMGSPAPQPARVQQAVIVNGENRNGTEG